MSLSAEEIERVYERRYAGFRLGVGAILNDFDAAHDAVQDGFARALAEREKCRGESPEAWIWRIVERTAFDQLRRRRRTAEPNGLSADVVLSESHPALAAAVKTLPPRRRLVVFLRYFVDLSYAEIARACGISEGTVAATLAQAHADLLRQLQVEEAPR
jgi:RNA polymerase sigma factor (sigma-70 family)